MRILSIDPGRHCGFCFGHTKDAIAASGVWDLGPDAGARPAKLAGYLRATIAQHQPEVVAVEVAGMGGRFALPQMRLNELAGVIKATAAACGCEVWEFHIGTWKKLAVGSGKAEKADVIRGLKTFFGITITSEDEADAVGIYLAAALGPPPLPAKKETKRIEKVLAKRQGTLFGGRRR